MNSVITALDSSVQGQGIRVSVRDWLDIGSEGWKNTPDKVKAAAYQAAKANGWTDKGLLALMVHEFGPRIDEDTAKFTLECLKDAEKEFPLELIEEKKDHKDVLRVGNADVQL